MSDRYFREDSEQNEENDIERARKAISIEKRLRKNYRKAVIEKLLHPEYVGKWIKIQVHRDKTNVHIGWTFHDSVKYPMGHSVSASMLDIALVPSEEEQVQKICQEYGNGEVRLELEEGHSYFFDFHIIDRASAKLLGHDDDFEFEDYYDIINFQIGIPLSDERKILLPKAAEIASDGRKKAAHAVQKHLDLEDTFDEWLQIGIERINAKNLSAREKKDRVAAFREKIAWLKSEMGL